jgi:transposase InsO family protein
MRTDEEIGYLKLIIQEVRKDHPTLSFRAMYYKIQSQNIGRDRFELLCKDLGFTVSRKHNKHRTTNSTGVIRFDNLLENLVLDRINQAWSSDITYFEISGVFYYITFILDCYSRLIIGHSVSKRLLTEQTTLPALQMALKMRKNNIPDGLIFHSDGGGQYYDKEFIKLTQKYQMQNSMCEMAYDNGKAERLNGVIKNNYLAYYTIKSFDELVENVDRAVSLYNNDRPHKSIKYKTPIAFEKSLLISHLQTKPKMKESFEAKTQIYGVSNPIKSVQTKPQNQDVFNANVEGDLGDKTVNVI